MAVVDCLEDSDETLRKKTLDLLYTMTKPNNVEVIVERMLAFLGRDGDKYSDKFVREQTASRVAELAERYAPDAKWYVDTMTELFEVAGDVVKPSIGHGLMRLISEGTGDEVADNLSRKSAVDAYLKLFKSNFKSVKSTFFLKFVICIYDGNYPLCCWKPRCGCSANSARRAVRRRRRSWTRSSTRWRRNRRVRPSRL